MALFGLPKAPPMGFSPNPSLVGNDQPPIASFAPGNLQQPLPAPPPPKRKASAFDDDHYQQTMLAIAAGFFGSNNFGDGLANAAKSIYNQNDMIRQEGRPTLGGPDDAFEIYTDPQTGEHVFKPIQAAIDYQRHKVQKPAQRADMVGRVHYAISQLPPEQQAEAWADVQSNPEAYNLTDEDVAGDFDPTRSAVLANTGMTVSQARTRKQAELNADEAEKARQAALDLRRQAVEIARRRAEASISQGQQRIGIAQQALAKRGAGGGKGGKTPISEQTDAELLSIIFGN